MAIKDKIIAFDLDGTLARNDACVSSFSGETIAKLVQDGYKITLITGRQWVSSKSSYEICKLNMEAVLANGSVIYNPITDEKIFENEMDEKFIFDLIDNQEFVDLIKDVFFEHDLDTYSLKRTESKEHFITGNFHQTKDCIATSLVILLNKPEDTIRVKEIIEATNPKYTFRSWGCLGEVYDSEFNKKIGTEVLLKHLNKSFEDLIFFGDASNDIEILEAAGIGICMKNGNENAKMKANFITDFTNDEDGAVKYLLKLIENEKD